MISHTIKATAKIAITKKLRVLIYIRAELGT
jgi:hypothetical protein